MYWSASESAQIRVQSANQLVRRVQGEFSLCDHAPGAPDSAVPAFGAEENELPSGERPSGSRGWARPFKAL